MKNSKCEHFEGFVYCRFCRLERFCNVCHRCMKCGRNPREKSRRRSRRYKQIVKDATAGYQGDGSLYASAMKRFQKIK